tara:strand:+ start:591 stop:977 length:387 start_codon:yes stop_codon:yes gene_type:complete
MSIEVVYNEQYGGFSLSEAAAKRMAELGNEEAIEEVKRIKEERERLLEEWEKKLLKECITDIWDFYLEKTPRHDPILVQTVRELGLDKASGGSCTLKIKTLKGNRYIIRECDGAEWIVEPDDMKWIHV